MNLPDFLTHADGEVRIAGTRIGLYHVLLDYNHGDTAEVIALRYPHVPLATVHKLIGFYLDNKAEVDQYCADYQAELDRLRATGKTVDLDALLARVMTKRATASP